MQKVDIMKKLTEDKIQHIFRRADHTHVKEFTTTFNKYAEVFGFTTDFQVNAFLAEIEEEVGLDLIPKHENLNYSCKALKALFRYYKRNPNMAKKHGRCNGYRADQKAIANHAYANRGGNGDPLSGDGWRYAGNGFIQLTLKSNYMQIATALSLVLGEVITPKILSKKMTGSVKWSLLSAMAFYFTHKMYNAKTVDQMTAIVNKHTHSYEQRKKHYMYIASL